MAGSHASLLRCFSGYKRYSRGHSSTGVWAMTDAKRCKWCGRTARDEDWWEEDEHRNCQAAWERAREAAAAECDKVANDCRGDDPRQFTAEILSENILALEPPED
jgi:hypothetical protein